MPLYPVFLTDEELAKLREAGPPPPGSGPEPPPGELSDEQIIARAHLLYGNFITSLGGDDPVLVAAAFAALNGGRLPADLDEWNAFRAEHGDTLRVIAGVA